MTKKTIFIIVIMLLVSSGIYLVFKKDEPPLNLFEVTRGNVTEELWETGRIQRGERINLSFQSAGEIEKIYIQTNQAVKKGEILAKLNTADLELQLQTARSSFEVAQLNLKKLLAGADPEEIKITQAQAENARIFLDGAEESLENSYQSAVTILNSSHPQIYNALDFTKEFVREYVVIYDEDGRKLMKARDEINSAEETAKSHWEDAKKLGAGRQDIETALSVMRGSLETTFNSLEAVREIIDKSAAYRDKVSAADKVFIGTLKTNVNSALTNIIASQQAISSMKLNIETAKRKLQEAENYLALVTAGAGQVDTDLYQAQIRQAQLQVLFYENQIEKSTLRSPVNAQVAQIRKREGEAVQAMPADTVISLLPVIPFEIAADIYEEDIVKIKMGALVEISLPAFPGETFTGSVIFIDETEKIIDGVVYYEIKASFDKDPPQGLRTTMTADIVIQVGLEENVLVVPRDAIQRVGEKTTAEVFSDDIIREREVEIGLRGDDYIEIIAGLTEGEKVVIR